MRPKISFQCSVNYDELLNSAKFAFLYSSTGGTKDRRPYIIVKEDVVLDFIELDVLKDGITIKRIGCMPKDSNIDIDTLTVDINKLICDWLVGQGGDQLIISFEDKNSHISSPEL